MNTIVRESMRYHWLCHWFICWWALLTRTCCDIRSIVKYEKISICWYPAGFVVTFIGVAKCRGGFSQCLRCILWISAICYFVQTFPLRTESESIWCRYHSVGDKTTVISVSVLTFGFFLLGSIITNELELKFQQFSDSEKENAITNFVYYCGCQSSNL